MRQNQMATSKEDLWCAARTPRRSLSNGKRRRTSAIFFLGKKSRVYSPFVLMMTLSIPLSSALSICKKSPTVCVIGLNIKQHFSRREGSGTVMWGSPFLYSSLTSMSSSSETKGKEELMNWN